MPLKTQRRSLINKLLTQRQKEDKTKVEWVGLEMKIFMRTKRILVRIIAIDRRLNSKQKQLEKIQRCNQEPKAKEWNHKVWSKNQKISQ